MTSIMAVTKYSPSLELNSSDVHLSYLPLPHIFDRLVTVSIFSFGGSVYFYGGDIFKLKEDIEEAKPTIFCSVPRLYVRFYDGITAALNLLPAKKKKIADFAFKKKKKSLY